MESPLPSNTRTPSSTDQWARIRSSALAWAAASCSLLILARDFGSPTRPFQPPRSLPLKSRSKPLGGVFSSWARTLTVADDPAQTTSANAMRLLGRDRAFMGRLLGGGGNAGLDPVGAGEGARGWCAACCDHGPSWSLPIRRSSTCPGESLAA